MGLGPAARELWSLLDLKPPASICDLGSQEMSYVDSQGNVTHRQSAREWLEGQGFTYACVDADGNYGALRLDLNTCDADDVANPLDASAGVFDVVTNHGTSEHVFDQANVFKLMHDLTKSGGIMVHAVPTLDFGASHGFYFYDESLFKDLARYNDYEVLHMFRRREPFEIILVAFRKTTWNDFRAPMQAMYDPSLKGTPPEAKNG